MYDDEQLMPKYFGVPIYHFGNISKIAKEVIDKRSKGYAADYRFTAELREGQMPLIKLFCHRLTLGQTGYLLEAPPGFGKSHPKGTELRMFDGSVKKVEDIVVGDLLMGPDSAFRRVLNTHKGFGPIYRITPKKGDAWECNECHVLSLKLSPFFQQNGNRKGGRIRSEEFVDIALDEYLKKSNNFKHRFKLWRASVELARVKTTADSYVVGLYLADGRKEKQSVLYCGEKKRAAIDYVFSYWKERGVVCFDKGCWSIPLHNFGFIRKSLVKYGERYIPKEYLINDREHRLQLLAGILDGDGSLVAGTVFELFCKDTGFKEQVLFLCRSLGFAAYASLCEKRIKATGFIGNYWRIMISGDTHLIPTKVKHKQASKRRQKKNPLVTGFFVEYMRDDDYYGIALDGDGRYLLKDFTVTHNTVCILRMLQEIGRTALIVVPKKDLVQQWTDRIVEHTNIPRKKIGIASAGKVRYGGCKVVVGLVHTLALDRAGANFRKYFGAVVYDEVDRSMPPATFAPVVNLFPCVYRIGASAVMERQDGLETIFEKHLEQVRLRGRDTGRMKPKVLIHKFSGDSGAIWKGSRALNRRGMLLSKLSKNTARNALISRYVHLIWKSGRRLVVISDRTEQLVFLRKLCNKLKKIPLIRMGFYADKVPIGSGGRKVQISKVELESNAKDKDILFATYGMMALGTDIQDLAGIIYATPQSEIKQSKGRIERICDGKKKPVVVDIVDIVYPDAVRWGYKRVQQYQSENLNITTYKS